jgi:hypothetical protein
MVKPSRDRLLQRGVWLLVVGVFTSWLFGLGLLFILAAAFCGFLGLFRERALQSALLLMSSLVLGGICAFVSLHLAAIAGIYAFNRLPADPPEPALRVSQE